MFLLVIVGVLGVLYTTIANLNDSTSRVRHSKALLISADRLERLAADLERDKRGFIMTGDKRFSQPWNTARAAFAAESAELRRHAEAAGPAQRTRAAEIVRASSSYLAAQRNPSATSVDPRGDEGERGLGDLRTRFDGFAAAQREAIEVESANADAAATRTVIISLIGAAMCLLSVPLFAGHLSRTVVRPVRRVSAMAADLARGELTVRVPETSPGEIGVLERSFNTIAGVLEESCATVQRNAEEQRALKRIATLVTRSAPPEAIFNAAAAEMGRVLGLMYGVTERFEPDSTFTVLGAWGVAEPVVPIGSRWPLEGETVASQIMRTGRPARITYGDATSDIARWCHEHGFKSGVGCPIVVDRRLWGMVFVLSKSDDPMPEGTEKRMVEFTELIGTAIASAESREQLRASRARMVTASDATRRRIERNLHDSTQQHLISLGLELCAIQELVPAGQARQRLAASSRRLTEIVEDLREISRGLHPAILSRSGLETALKALRHRSSLPIELDLNLPGRLPEPAEVAAYYTVSEAVTNATKHANASAVHVAMQVRDGTVHLCVRDDGVGGADFGEGSGLIGIRDRVEALGGRIDLTSPAGKGTSLHAEIPID
ncbi:HAMP domain-containing protein [Actinoallomurus iriomotensis]|uniref:HAMP domain-containing protein n=1 Tax=Actinoallomurus iriomotensis TaxID=478107 RepID=UPI0025531FB1|nr:HAMP domain-containing protein [Actinoallomurus iriomotensis]